MIATVNPHNVPNQDEIGSWVQLLHPDGVLAVLTHTGHHDGRLVDPTGAVIAAAQDADLLYLQHIVVITTDPSDTTAVPTPGHPANGSALPHRAHRRSNRRHRPVHADLLIFLNTTSTRTKSPGGPR